MRSAIRFCSGTSTNPPAASSGFRRRKAFGLPCRPRKPPRRDYGVTIAEVAAATYGKPADSSDIRSFGIGRAEAMAFRDARGQAITDADWSSIETQLRNAYQRLKAGVEAALPPRP